MDVRRAYYARNIREATTTAEVCVLLQLGIQLQCTIIVALHTQSRSIRQAKYMDGHAATMEQKQEQAALCTFSYNAQYFQA